MQHRRLYAAGIAALVLGVIAIVVVADPLATIVTAFPLRNLPDLNLPDLPGWATWLRRGILVVLVALAVVGGIEKARKDERAIREDEKSR